MLNSSNQYLRPEYLSPLPTTLDAKKSPLALLAQTCSNIGADNPNNKPIIPALEKSKDTANEKKDKSPVIVNDDSNNSNSKPSFKPYESVIKKDDSNNNSEICGKKTPSSKRSSPAVSSRSPAASVGSCGKLSPAASDSGSSIAARSESGNLPSLAVSSSTSTSSTTCASQNTLSGLGYGSAGSLDLELGRNDSKDTLTESSLNGLNPLANCTGCGPIPGHPIPVDTVSTAHTYPPSIATQSGALKATYPLSTSAMSPYVGYARIKTASGGTTLVPVCRDPYCTNCQLSMQSAQLSVCPSGCTQCNHERLAPSALGLGHHSSGLMPGLTGSAAAMAAAAAAGGVPGLSYPHSLLPRPNVCSWIVGDTYCGKRFSSSEELLQHLRTHMAAAAAGGVTGLSYPHSLLSRPNVCSWIVGDTYCGKRFSSSEELLQHLRTHTNLSTSESPLSLVPPAFSLASGNLGAACHLHYSSAPSLTSAAGLRRTYPTSLSPVSSLSAASRYHPYKSPLSSLQGAPLPPLGHPGLGLYYSPYSLYGQRLGPPVHP